MRSHKRAALWAALLSLLLAASAAEAQPTPLAGPLPEGFLVVTDQGAFTDNPATGPFWGGVWLIDPDVDSLPESPLVVADSQTYFPRVWHVQVLGLTEILVADSSADPAGLGLDGNPEGDSGPGAILSADSVTGAVRVVSDGTLAAAGVSKHATGSVFAGPRDMLILPNGDLLVVDPDADPSGLGFDPGRPDIDPAVAPHAGYGALLRIDLETGEVSLVSDGRNYAGPFPDIGDDGFPEPSIFLDPWALADDPTDPDAVFILDTLADPNDLEEVGAVFRVTLSTGEVELAATHPEWRFVNDIVWKQSLNGLLVLDNDPITVPDTDDGGFYLVTGGPGAWNTVPWAAPDAFAFVYGMIVDQFDQLFAVDSDGDPFGIGAFGAVQLMPDGDPNNPQVVASSLEMWRLLFGDYVPTGGWPVAVDTSVTTICNNQDVPLQITGASFDPGAVVRGDGRVVVRSSQWVDPNTMNATIFASCDVLAGSYSLRVINPNGQADSVSIVVDPTLGGVPPRSPAGDITGDEIVDGLDLARVGMAFGGMGGCCDPGWDADADLNFDGRVDGLDVAILSAGFGRMVTP